MQTKSKIAHQPKANAKQTRLIAPCVNIFVAEDFREEKYGKVTAVGLYATRSLSVAIPAEVTPSSEKPIRITSLSFLAAIRGFVGPQDFSVGFSTPESPDQPIWQRKQRHIFRDASESVNLIIRGQPFMVTSFGPRLIVVKVGSHTESAEFEILRGSPPIARPDEQLHE